MIMFQLRRLRMYSNNVFPYATEKAIDYAVDKMKTLGFDKVSTENVTSPKWTR